MNPDEFCSSKRKNDDVMDRFGCEKKGPKLYGIAHDALARDHLHLYLPDNNEIARKSEEMYKEAVHLTRVKTLYPTDPSSSLAHAFYASFFYLEENSFNEEHSDTLQVHPLHLEKTPVWIPVGPLYRMQDKRMQHVLFNETAVKAHFGM